MDGEVYSFPLAPNLQLLAFCQTILALPLILVWALQRWRRMMLNFIQLPQSIQPPEQGRWRNRSNSAHATGNGNDTT